MLKGFTALVLLQLLGSIVNWAFLPLLPGPIIGMLLLLGWLMLQGGVSDAVSAAAGGLLQYLPLLLVVPAVGIMTSGKILLDEWVAIASALVLSLLVTVPLCGWLMERMIRRIDARGGDGE